MPRTKWPILPTTLKWQHDLAAELRRRGYGSKRLLADYLGVSQSTVSHLIDGDRRSSQYVEPASKWANIALPIVGDRQWIELGIELAALSPQKYNELLQKGRALAAATKKRRKRRKGLD